MTSDPAEKMQQEIELKFIVDTAQLAPLREALSALPASAQGKESLLSTYYDTPDHKLRNLNAGLRVRQQAESYMMTLKLAGRVIGGLHQRPEYNQPLASAALDLSLFDSKIWPQGVNIDTLAGALTPLFTTEFQRETWQLEQGESRIEIALDQGEIRAGERVQALCELELELLSGRAADLLALAGQLIALPGLRQSELTKAARGYALAQAQLQPQFQPQLQPQLQEPQTLQTDYPLKPLAILRLAGKSNVEQGFEGALDLALSHWLYHEEAWLHGTDGAQAQVRAAVNLARHSLTLFNNVIPRKASSELRDQLTACDSLLAGDQSAHSLLFSPPMGAARLALTSWLLNQHWRGFLDDEGRANLAGSFKRFADIQLSRLAAELKRTFARPLQHYGDQLPRLARALDSVHLLAGAYNETRVRGWLENWQSLAQAIAHQCRADIDRYRQLSISQPPFWLNSGKKI